MADKVGIGKVAECTPKVLVMTVPPEYQAETIAVPPVALAEEEIMAVVPAAKVMAAEAEHITIAIVVYSAVEAAVTEQAGIAAAVTEQALGLPAEAAEYA